MLAVRIHLDRADAANGALRVIPGSHCYGKLTQLEIDRWKQFDRAITCVGDAGSILYDATMITTRFFSRDRP